MKVFWLRIFAAKAHGLFSKRQDDSELDTEIRAHLRLLAERFMAHGMSPAAAAAAARRQFGNTSLLQENHREQRSLYSLEALWRDVRFGARQLRRNPLFTAVAVVTLALGIGANTAVFTLLDQLVLRLLPVKDPARLVMIWPEGKNLGNAEGPRAVSYPMYQDFQRQSGAFESVICQYDSDEAVTIDGGSERAAAELVSGNYFQALGVRPALGRVFSSEQDDRVYRGHPVVVLSHAYWVSRFAADRKIVGKKILVNNYPMEIVGVSAAGFAGLDPTTTPDLRIPILMLPVLPTGGESLVDRRDHWLHVFARLKPGFTADTARAAVEPLFQQILREELQNPLFAKSSAYDRDQFMKQAINVETAATGYSDLRGQYSTALIVLMCMAGLILLIACSNVASLLIARAVARQKEIAVRLAIGAGRRTLIRTLVVESLLLSIAGAALGLLLSEVATRTLLAMLPTEGTRLALHPNPDARILCFSAAVALLTGLLFGIVPALQGTRVDVWTALAESCSSLSGVRGSTRLRRTLVTVQVALSFLLLAGAGLFSRTLMNLKNSDLGMRAHNLVTFRVDPRGARYTVLQIRTLYENTLREIRALPGVKAAAFSVVPVLHGYEWTGGVSAESYQAKDGEDTGASYNIVSPGYWETMGIPLIAGRDFDDRDRFVPGHESFIPTVAIINRKCAEYFFGKLSPIGKHIGNGVPDAKVTTLIVGEVENSVYQGPRQGIDRGVYLPQYEAPEPMSATFYVRTSAESSAIFPLLRGLVAKSDPTLPIFETKTLDAQLDEELSTERLIASLSVVFGALATALAALGLYGVTAFAVARRTKEIGLRMALGAEKGSVVWLVLREALLLLAVGIAAGLPCAYVLTRYITAQLYGVPPTDVWTTVAAVVVLVAVAALSGFLPARRASGIDPLKALRYE